MKRASAILFLVATLAVVSLSMSLEKILRRGINPITEPTGEFEATLIQALHQRTSFEEFVQVVSGMQHASKAEIKAVKRYIERIQVSVAQEQARHEKLYRGQVSTCKNEKAYRVNEISAATADLSRASESHGKCKSTVTKSQNAIDKNLHFQSSKETELKGLKEIREEQNRVYKENLRDLQDAKRTLKEVVPLIESLVSPVMLEVSNTANMMTAVEAMSKKSLEFMMLAFPLTKSDLFSESIQMLAQITTQGVNIKPADVARMLDLITRLQLSIDEEIQHLQENENTSLEAYQKQVESIEQVQDVLKEQEHQLKGLRDSAKSCVQDDKLVIRSSSARKRRNEQLLKKARKMCQSTKKEYRVVQKSRQESLELFKKIDEWLDAYEKNQEQKAKKESAKGKGDKKVVKSDKKDQKKHVDKKKDDKKHDKKDDKKHDKKDDKKHDQKVDKKHDKKDKKDDKKDHKKDDKKPNHPVTHPIVKPAVPLKPATANSTKPASTKLFEEEDNEDEDD